MKRYLKYFVLLLLGALALASCNGRGATITSTDKPNPTTTEAVTEYNIRFLQDDNATVIKEMKVKAGDKVTYTGDTPTKASDSEYDYTFKEWNPALTTATKDQDYVAVYDKKEKTNPNPGNTDVIEIDFDKYVTDNNISKGKKVTEIKIGNITLSVEGESNSGKMYPADDYNEYSTWRLYGKENATLTITSSTNNIENITIYSLDKDYEDGYMYDSDNNEYASGDEIEVNGKSITLYADSNQTRIYKIELTYEGAEGTEYSIENALKAFAEEKNYKVIFKMTGNGDYQGESNFNYTLTESHADDKIKVVESYTYYFEDYEYTNYFYYDKDGVLHFVYIDTSDDEGYDDYFGDMDDYDDFDFASLFDDEDDEEVYIDISENNPDFDEVLAYNSYYKVYDFKAIKLDDLEKVSANTYQVKADKLSDVVAEIFGETHTEGEDEDTDGFKYEYEATEDFKSITIKIKDDKIVSIVVKSAYSMVYDYEEADEEGVTHYEYTGDLTYTFKYSEFGLQEVSIPDAEKYVTKYTITELFDLEDGVEVSFDSLYVNGVNTTENIVYVCDDYGSIAVSVKDITIDTIPVVGATVKLEGKVSVNGNLVMIDATSMEVDNSNPTSMANMDIDTLVGVDYSFAGETINFDYFTLITKDIDNLNVVFEELSGASYKLSFVEEEKDEVTELFKQIDVNTTIKLKNVAVMIEEDEFVIKLMDHATYEVIDGFALKSNSTEVEPGTSLIDACKDAVIYYFVDGVRTAVDFNTITVTSAEYDKDKAGTYLVNLTFNDSTVNYYVTVKVGTNVDAFKETAGKGIPYASDRYSVPYGIASTTPEGKETLDILVIPVAFNNVQVPNNYKELLEKGFNGTSADTGWESFSSYYFKTSYGKLKFHANIMDVYNTGDPYYKSQKEVGNKEYPNDYLDGYSALDLKYLDKAVAHYDDVIDYNDYDSNKDGNIDCVYLVYLAPYSTDDDALDYWWAYNNKTYDEIETEYDGLAFDTYMWFSYEFFNDKIDGHDEVKVNAETVIHESGHALGLDDYYDTTYDGNGGLGSGFMMDANVGDHDPYSKALLGWITPTIVIDRDTTIELSSFEATGDAIFIYKNYNGIYFNEYYIIDYYTPTGLNELEAGNFGVPSIEGVRIYHVNAVPKENESQIISIWDVTNTSNSNGANKLISIVEADGNDSILEGNYMSNDDLWQKTNVADELTWADGTLCNFTIEIVNIENGTATINIKFVNEN